MAVLVLTGAVTFVVTRSEDQPTAPAGAVTTGQGYLLPAPTRHWDVCLDKSGSVDRDHRLAGRATDLLVRKVSSLHPAPVEPYTTKPTEPVKGVDLTVRVVRKNSYDTTPDTRYVVHAEIPAVSGLKEAPTGAEARANWDKDKATVVSEQNEAKAAQKRIAGTFGRLASLESDGSDVVGCVAAALEARGAETPVSLWIVSDLDTYTPRGGDGKPLPPYQGRFPHVEVVITQACPGGSQSRCEQKLAGFKDLMAGLGISQDRIKVRPSASLEDAYALWTGMNP